MVAQGRSVVARGSVSICPFRQRHVFQHINHALWMSLVQTRRINLVQLSPQETRLRGFAAHVRVNLTSVQGFIRNGSPADLKSFIFSAFDPMKRPGKSTCGPNLKLTLPKYCVLKPNRWPHNPSIKLTLPEDAWSAKVDPKVTLSDLAQ